MRVAVIIGSMSDLPKIEPAIKILKDFGVKRCYFGHIHGLYDIPASFERDGIKFIMTSADFLNFTPLFVGK